MKKQFLVKLFACIYLSLYIFQADASRRYQELQDVIVDNVVVQPGLSDCQKSYDIIKSVLAQYKRPITVLDLGAGQGYFSFQIAREFKYGSTCVMVEDNDGSVKRADMLEEFCRLNSHLQNIVLLKKKMSLKELEKLADCEHFDIVLAFDYIDHEDCDWKQTVNAILRLGSNIFIQAPWSSVSSENATKRRVVEYLAEQSGKLILQTPCASDPEIQEQMFWFERNKDGLRCKCFAWESRDSYKKLFRINSSFTHKTLLKKGSMSGPEWKKGINLVTFLMLNGAYPARNSIKQEVAKLTREKVTDFAPWNLIIQGDNVVLIDQKDKGWHADVKKSVKFINKVVDQTSPSRVSKLLNKSYLHKQHLRKNKWSWISRMVGL